MAGVALFDLDRTLLDCNSGRLWVQHEWRTGRLRSVEVLLASWWLLRYSLGSDAGLEEAFRAAVGRLAGLREGELQSRVDAWFQREVAHRLRPGARQALEAHRQAGDRLVLATSSTSHAAAAARRAFALDDVVCTCFEVVDGAFTGRIAELAAGPAKAERVLEWARRHDVDLAQATFYTDSATDLALLERVGRPVAVHPDRALARIARRRGWEIVDWGRAPARAVPGGVVV